MGLRMSSVNAKYNFQLISGSLAASSFVAFTQIVSRGSNLDASLYVAIFCFALGIPMLAVLATVPISQAAMLNNKKRPHRAWTVAPMLLPIIGVGSMFASYGSLFLIVYVLGVCASLLLAKKFTGK